MNNKKIKIFRSLYNRLDEVISERVSLFRRRSFVQKLNKFVQKHPSFRQYKSEIRMIHDLRNIIVHEEKLERSIAIPTNELLERVKILITKIENPQTAFEIASKTVFGCEFGDDLLKIIKIMGKNVYSQVPVFEDKKKKEGFVGVLSESSIILYLARTGADIDAKTKVEKLSQFISKPVKEGWEFIAKDTDVLKVSDLFQNKVFANAQLENAKLGVVFVTKTGSKMEKIEGVITSWDLSKINR